MPKIFFFKNIFIFLIYWMILITALLKGFDWLVGETESGVSNGAQTIFLSLVMVCLRYGSDYFKLKNAGENPGWEHGQ